MSLVASALIGGGASLLGGILGRSSAKKQAQKQMDFQREMSNTAYQRAAKDLEAAGLNRILALGKPASSPGGAMAPMTDVVTPAAATAMAARRHSQELKNMKEQQTLTRVQGQHIRNQEISSAVQSRIDTLTEAAFMKHPWAREAAMLSDAVNPTVGSAYGLMKLAEGHAPDWFKNLLSLGGNK